FLDSPKEKQLKREIAQLQDQYDLLNQRIELANSVLKDLQVSDDQIYRVVFEAEPIPAEVREAGAGGINRYKLLEGFDNSDLLIKTTQRIDKLTRQLYIQSKSFDEVFKLAKQKTQMLASIPGIQPVAIKGSARLVSGFGYRIHPIYKTAKMHTGIDFAAPTGTPIYSTGNGVVSQTEFNGRGYGNNVVINHGYGYQTLYGHMTKFVVRPGQKVQRGDLIGYVGSTGSSTGPHCHYEVIKDGNKIDPINYFYNDLTPQEYEQIRILAAQENQSFD
ncbi:MAG: peptidoglycan DD-metalloendopeptidase family protein, partial [Bacteroidota bacterium]